MIKLLAWLLWPPANKLWAEFDIEHVQVISIERHRTGQTVIGYILNGTVKDYWLNCTEVDHARFIDRFRHKLTK